MIRSDRKLNLEILILRTYLEKKTCWDRFTKIVESELF